jgi:Fic family protein
MLFRSVRLGSEELDVIESIRETYKSLQYSISSPLRWLGVLRRNTFARAIQGSNSIEGYVVTKEDALAAADGDEPLEAERETWLAVMGYRNAMTYVLQLAKDQNFVLNDGFLRSFHFMMLQHDLSKHPGNWRPGPIYVRDEEKGENVYEGPPAEMVPKLIGELIDYLAGKQDDDHLFVMAALAHLNLVMIHPFSDGNGRMARCLQTLVLARRGIGEPTFSSIEEYLGRNTKEYYQVLANVGKGSWNPKNDTREWIRFNLTAHYRQSTTLLGRSRMIAKLWDELERTIKENGLPERTIFALSDAAMGYLLRSSHYRLNADVSSVVASRDLKWLVKTGLLIPKGEKRGRIYAGSESIRDTWIRIRNAEPREIKGPFGKAGGK